MLVFELTGKSYFTEVMLIELMLPSVASSRFKPVKKMLKTYAHNANHTLHKRVE